MKLNAIAKACLCLLIAACSALPTSQAEVDSTPGEGSATGNASQPAPDLTETPEGTPSPEGPAVLRIWVTPEFNPGAGTPAGGLLSLRLEEFAISHPGIELDVRVKATGGAGGILDSLTAARAAAPGAAPDLVALPRSILEAAALKGLLFPYDDLSTEMDGEDWYGYARQLSQIQDSVYGIPFAGNLMLVVYRQAQLGELPQTLNEAIQLPGRLALPAADPRAAFTLSLYLSAGGKVQDEDGRPALDAAALTQALQFYRSAGSLLPRDLVTLRDDAAVLTAIEEERAAIGVLWGTEFFRGAADLPTDSALAPVPSFGSQPGAPADGWVWALTGNQPEKVTLAADLAEFLVEPEFLGSWTRAAGVFPPRAEALGGWEGSPYREVIGEVSESARLIPSSGVLSTLAPVLNQAVQQVLAGEKTPGEAAQEAAGKVK